MDRRMRMERQEREEKEGKREAYGEKEWEERGEGSQESEKRGLCSYYNSHDRRAMLTICNGKKPLTMRTCDLVQAEPAKCEIRCAAHVIHP
jgi:hypothetical protein